MKEIMAVFLKQVNETLKNKTVLIQFLMLIRLLLFKIQHFLKLKRL